MRYLLVHYYYRNIIRCSERVFQLRRKANTQDGAFWANELRKNAHILDKGLQRKDWETGHGTVAFRKAKYALTKIIDEDLLSDPSVKWAKSKIREFEAENGSRKSAPVLLSTSCSYESLLDVVRTRRSIRHFKDEPISNEDIRRIVEVVNWSPTSCHRQTAKVFVATEPKSVKQCMDLCAGSSGFGRRVPLFICFCSDFRAYQMPVEGFLPHIDVSLGIQNCNLIAHSLGVSLTMLSWAQSTEREDREMRKLLRIPQEYGIIVNAVGGYPACGAPTPERKTLSSTLVQIDE